MLTTLLASPEGVRLLSTEDEFLPQIRSSFAQLDPVFGAPRWLFLRKADVVPLVQWLATFRPDIVKAKDR